MSSVPLATGVSAINENPSLAQLQAFLGSSQEVHFRAEGRAEIYAWVGCTLKQQNYRKLSRADKGLVRGYVKKMTGLSRAQVSTPSRAPHRSRSASGAGRIRKAGLVTRTF